MLTVPPPFFSPLQALAIPKSDLQITQGFKSRDKTVVVGGELVTGGEEECLERVKASLGRG